VKSLRWEKANYIDYFNKREEMAAYSKESLSNYFSTSGQFEVKRDFLETL
jgi:hypothetical protein